MSLRILKILPKAPLPDTDRIEEWDVGIYKGASSFGHPGPGGQVAYSVLAGIVSALTIAGYGGGLLPQYTGPQVTIRIKPSNNVYMLPKGILCKQSPYFAAIFERDSKEGSEQSTTLEEIDGVVSDRSFQMLAQWICSGRIIFGGALPKEDVTAAIEFARFADMCGVTGVESLMADHIKRVILANPGPVTIPSPTSPPDRNTFAVTSENIASATSLPTGIQCGAFWRRQRSKDIFGVTTTSF